MEKRIHSIWKTLLNTDQIGVDDNFFQLGGGSVLAMRLVSMVRREGMAMTVNSIFKAPTLKDLALTVRQNISTTDLATFALLNSQYAANLCQQAVTQCGIGREDIEDIYPCALDELQVRSTIKVLQLLGIGNRKWYIPFRHL
jgi:aryl carrier-like protein